MGNLDETLAKKMKKLGIERQVEAAGVVETAQKEIAKFIDPNDFEVISFKNKTLKVYVSSGPVSKEVMALKEKLNPQLKIEKLRIQIK